MKLIVKSRSGAPDRNCLHDDTPKLSPRRAILTPSEKLCGGCLPSAGGVSGVLRGRRQNFHTKRSGVAEGEV